MFTPSHACTHCTRGTTHVFDNMDAFRNAVSEHSTKLPTYDRREFWILCVSDNKKREIKYIGEQ